MSTGGPWQAQADRVALLTRPSHARCPRETTAGHHHHRGSGHKARQVLAAAGHGTFAARARRLTAASPRQAPPVAPWRGGDGTAGLTVSPPLARQHVTRLPRQRPRYGGPQYGGPQYGGPPVRRAQRNLGQIQVRGAAVAGRVAPAAHCSALEPGEVLLPELAWAATRPGLPPAAVAGFLVAAQVDPPDLP